jgi:hypothetical protein
MFYVLYPFVTCLLSLSRRYRARPKIFHKKDREQSIGKDVEGGDGGLL